MSWRLKAAGWRQVYQRINWYLCLGVLFLLAVIAGFSAVAWKLHIVLTDADAMPIEMVAVKGERKYTSDAAIQAALQNLMTSSFFSADVSQVQQTLEDLPWVYSASVRREWPAKLKVFIQEQKAAAHWNGDAWLNEYGEVFDAPPQSSLQQLPELAGPESMARQILESYDQINSLLKIHDYGLRSLNLSPRHAWRATLNSGIMLELGREDKMARIQRFIDVYPTLKNQSKVVAKVDLRYDTGLAVGWDDTEKENR